MNKKYNLKLDLQFRCNNSTMKFDEFDNNTSDFFIRVTRAGELIDISKAIVTLVVIKPDNSVDAQFVDIDSNRAYCDLKPTMKNLVGKYEAIASITVDGETVNTGIDNPIIYEVTENKFLRQLNQKVVTEERFTLLTDMINRLSTIEISEEQRVINEAERILSEENRKIEEAKRVEAELIRQHEEADRSKYDAIRESNENIRKQNESIRLANETNRIDEEAKRVEEEAKRVEAEQLRKDNYNFMTEDEERRRLEANAHKEAEVLRVQAETIRVNEEAKRRTTEQGRVLAENTRVSNEGTRETNEETRQTNETHRVEAETQRQNRYNSFILEAEANASNFENYTNSAKVKEEERKSNELNRKSQEDRRVSNEVERISNENARKANEVAREKNETSRQNIFENKVDEVDTKISEIDNVKDNFVSSINTKVDTKISEIEVAKSDMTNTVSNKINEVETRFNALTSSQQQDAEVIDARDGETSLKSRLDRDIEKAKQVYVNVEGSHISTDSNVGYLKDVEILGNTIQSASNLADIRSVGDKIEGQELYEIPVLSCGKNVWNVPISVFNGDKYIQTSDYSRKPGINLPQNSSWTLTFEKKSSDARLYVWKGDVLSRTIEFSWASLSQTFTLVDNEDGISFYAGNFGNSPYDIVTVDFKIQLEEGTQATPYEPYVEDKLTILSPTPLEKVGDVADRIIEKDGIWGVEKNVYTATSDCFLQDSKKQLWHLSKSKVPSWISKNIWNEISNMVMCNYYGEVATYNEVLVTEGIFIDHKGTSPNIIIGTNDTNINSLPSDLITKYQLTTPQFIPLPHDQQIKLRTFANKTNISFLTEIEGTIKAQVPKSLGSSINTHTEQINNLNKELDRVKKLEESTVSTVTTESDFTTVEATSNGYFEDVKLEGRTLVNLCTHLYDQKHNSVIDKGSALNYTKHPHYTQCDFKLLQNLKQNTTYTVVLNVTNFVEGMSLQVNFYKYDEWIVCSNTEYVRNKGVHTVLLTTNENIADHIRIGKMNDEVENLDEYTTLSKDIIILEGDHTQNPPNGYIEGLKSVGDGIDEVSVKSVKGDGNLIDLNNAHSKKCIISNGSIVGTSEYNDIQFYVYLEKGMQYFFNSDGSHDVNGNIMHGMQKNYNASATLQIVKDLKTKPFAFIGDTGFYTLHIPNFRGIVKDIQLVKGTTPKTYTPHQSDKKRLLYYNEETQTWEKPILREWDSIEKHANGKYYYHKRSAEVVLNGSENWLKTSSQPTSGNHSRFIITNFPKDVVQALTVVICDKYNNQKLFNESSVGIYVDKNINITVDGVVEVEEFKNNLNTNNVTVVYQLAQEKVYECTNIDLITYANETNYIVNSGAISPKTTLKVHSNISNVVSLLQKKVSLLESNVKASQEVQDMMILETDMRMLDIELALMEFIPMTLNLGGSNMLRSATYFNFLKNHIINETYEKEYLENVMNKYLATGRINQDEYNELYKMLYPPVYDIELPIEY